MTIDDVNLTNDAKFLLSKMYAQYLEARTSGESKVQARLCAQNIPELQEKIMPEWTTADTLDTCLELYHKKLIHGDTGSNTIFRLTLSTDAIAMLEVSFKDKLDIVLDYAAKVKNLIPFI